MADLRNKYGDVVYRIEGDRINDMYGNWLYTIVGNRINDTYGNWKYNIVNEYLFDTSGNRIGEMKNLADILPSPKNTGSSSASSGSGRTSKIRGKPTGTFGWIFFIIIWVIFPFYENIRYFKDDATRKDYWGTLIRMFLLIMLLFIPFKYPGEIVGAVIAIITITLVSLRRMRDIGKSWWWILIPFANFIMCGFFPSK